MTTGRLIGIDHGMKRIGLAVSDALRLIARELTVITRRSKQEDFDQINRIAAEQGAVGFVIGLPADQQRQGDTYTQAERIRIWAERFAATTTRPIIFWDETLTSADAVEVARQQRRKPGDPIDDLAARLMLQSYLDALRDGLADPPPDDSPPPDR
jgi:putative Holliday junction resolvase